MSRIRSVLVAVCVLLAASTARAQQVGRITGVVRDGQLHPMVGIEVTAASRAVTRVAVTNAQGEFTVDSIPPGRVLVVAKRKGYGLTRRTELTMKGGETQQVEITMYVIAGATDQYFDPDVIRPIDFADPRGWEVSVIGNGSTSTLAIGGVEADGSASGFRIEAGNEFDTRWMIGMRGGVFRGHTKADVNFRYNARNTITYREYSTRRLDAFFRASPFSNTLRVRPYISGSFGLSRFSGDVKVTTLAQPAPTTGNGLVISYGGGVQFAARRNVTLDLGAEWSGTSFEEWRINNSVIGLPNLKVFGTDFILAVKWFPWAR